MVGRTAGRGVIFALVIGLACAGISSVAFGGTIKVPDDYRTLQQAINAAWR